MADGRHVKNPKMAISQIKSNQKHIYIAPYAASESKAQLLNLLQKILYNLDF